jgi:hypothetical protein
VINFINIKKHIPILSILIGLFFSACGEDREKSQQDTTEVKPFIGKLIDSAVQGVEYRCGETINYTDENGTFSCTSLPISFYIGAIQLGTVSTLPTDNRIFPQDIVNLKRSEVDNDEVIKLALLLQSLDSDHNASNGIVIENNLSDTFTQETIVKNLSLEELKDKIKEQNQAIIFEEIENVVKHLSFSVGIDNNSDSENNATLPTDNNNSDSENNTTLPIDNNSGNSVGNSTPLTGNNNDSNSENNTTLHNDTTAPTTPTLTFTPTSTQENNISVEVNGEVNTTLYINDINRTVIGNSGKVTVYLNTSGVDGIKTFNFVLKDHAQNQSNPLILKINKYTPDTTPPTTPTLTVTPNTTNKNSITVQLNGESNANVYRDDILIGKLNSSGFFNLELNTSGIDGIKSFNILIKDSANNSSNPLLISIIKDTIAPTKNSTINQLSTDDTTPALNGKLPHGDNDKNTTNYGVVVTISGTEYDATNNKNGTWYIEDDTINSLEEGFFSVTITVTDEAGNSSSTLLTNKIEINNTGFLIDSALEGIKYVSGSYSGYTDVNGLFKYEKGEGVSFYIGEESTGIQMGTAQTKVDPYNNQRKIITLFDLANTTDENHPRVLNMGKLLQSLDSDGDVSNGITIDKRTIDSIVLLNLKNHIDFNQDVDAFHENSDIYNLMNDLAGHFGEHRGLIATEDVKNHLVSVRDNKLATKKISITKVRGQKKVIKIFDGVFKSLDGIVQGLEYRSGNQFGRTDENGVFKYEEGKKIKFSIYQLELGTTESKAVITPADLIPSTSFNHPKPRNLIRLLNAFDAINGDNKITIDNAVREALEKYRSQIDINLPDGKADTELHIPQGKDEFGAQFEEFEMGKEILDEIDRLRI